MTRGIRMFISKRITILVLAPTLLLMSTAMAHGQVQVYRPLASAVVAGTALAQTSVEPESVSPAGKYYKVSVNGGIYTGDYCLYFDPNGNLYGFVTHGGWGPPGAPPQAPAAFWGAVGGNYGML